MLIVCQYSYHLGLHFLRIYFFANPFNCLNRNSSVITFESAVDTANEGKYLVIGFLLVVGLTL